MPFCLGWAAPIPIVVFFSRRFFALDDPAVACRAKKPPPSSKCASCLAKNEKKTYKTYRERHGGPCAFFVSAARVFRCRRPAGNTRPLRGCAAPAHLPQAGALAVLCTARGALAFPPACSCRSGRKKHPQASAAGARLLFSGADLFVLVGPVSRPEAVFTLFDQIAFFIIGIGGDGLGRG